MSNRPTGTLSGVILIGLGLLLVISSFGEQPDRVNLSPHRFYTVADRDEFQAAHEKVVNLKKGLGGVPQSGAEDNRAEDEMFSDGSDALATAQASFSALKHKQDTAFRNQEILSLTLKSIGIAFLGVGAFLLMRVSRATRLANAGNPLASIETSTQ